MIRFPIFLAVLALTSPTTAFEALWRDFAVVVGDESSAAPVFYYAAPDRTLDPGDRLWPVNRDIADAFYDPSLALTETGVNFGEAYAAFETGNPPDQINIVHGNPGFASGAPAVLGPEGFTASTLEGFELLSRGEDYNIDLQNRMTGDPFSGSLGRSYRLALADDYAVLTFSTGLMERTLAALAAPEFCAPCIPWRAMLDAVEKAAGTDATLVAASGYPAGALIVSPGDVDVPLASLPPYAFAMFAVTSGSGPELHLSVHFIEADSAPAGAKNLGNGIQALLDEVDEEGSPIFGGVATVAIAGPIVTVSVAFPHEMGPNLGYNRWIQLVMNRRFAALAPAL